MVSWARTPTSGSIPQSSTTLPINSPVSTMGTREKLLKPQLSRRRVSRSRTRVEGAPKITEIRRMLRREAVETRQEPARRV